MITASHNPPEYNGYKIYDSEGCQLSLEESEKVIRLVGEVKDELAVPCLSLEEAGDIIVMLDSSIDDEYAMRVENISISRDRESAGKLKVVYSPQHGTGNIPVRRVLADCGYDVIPVLSQCDPDPNFSGTESPNPESPKAYTEALMIAKESGADIVITTDPDCDRLGVAALNKAGEMTLMTGNQSAAVLLEYILSRRTTENSLPSDPYMLTTIVTSDLGDRICERYGVKVEKTLTGFKFIGDKIARHRAEGNYGFVFGYEESYDEKYWNDGYKDSFGLLYENICYSDMSVGLFDAIKELGSTKNVLVGHDHINNFSINYEGIRLTYSMASSSVGLKRVVGGTLLTINDEGKAVIGKCDVDGNSEITAKFAVRNIPTIIFLKNGELVDKLVGAQSKASLVEKIEKHL